MYKVYCNGKLLYDPRSKDLTISDPKLDLALNSAGSFSFKFPPGHPFYDAVQSMVSVISVYRDGTEIFSGRPLQQKDNFLKMRYVYVEGELAYLNDTIQRPAVYQDITVEGYLKAIIGIHNEQVDESKRFTVGRVTVVDSNDNLYRYSNYENTWQTLKEKLIDRLGGYFFIRKENGIRYLDYLAEMPRTSSQVIQFGKNMLDYSRNIDSSDIVTALIPLGCQLESENTSLVNRLTVESVNNGSDVIRSEDAIKEYGFICRTNTWDDVTVASNLMTKGKKWLFDTQWEHMALDVTAVDLHDLDVTADALNLGDNVRVYSKPHGMDRFFPVSKLTIYLDSPGQNRITLGISQEPLSSEQIVNVQNSVSEVQNNVEKVTVLVEETEKGLSTKVSKDDLVTEINQSEDTIELIGNRIIITSDKFKVSADGTVECVDGTFASSDGNYEITIKDGQVTMKANGMNGYINPASLYLGVTEGYYTQITGGSGVFSQNVSSGIVNATQHVQAPTVYANSFIGALASAYVALTYGSDPNYGTYVQIGGQDIATIGYVINAAVIIASNLISSSASDLRIKQDVTSLDTLETKEKWLEFLDEIKIKSFAYKPDTYALDDGKKHLGAIAQLIERSLEEKGLSDYGIIREVDYMEDSKAGEYTGGEKIKSVDYVGLIPLLILGYQELKKEIDELKKG